MRVGITFAGCILAPLALATLALAQAPRGAGPPPPSLEEGERVFEQSCGNQYCHGPGGRGAQGPRLAGIPMSADNVRATIREGRAGTTMAPFRVALEPAQLEAVIAFTLSIGIPGSPAPAAAGRGAPPPPAPSAIPVAIGKEQGTPAAGAELFFDATRLESCRTCHSFNRRGGPLGLDFADARKTPAEILASLSTPRVAARAFPVITVVTANGARLSGVRGRETEETLQLFDIRVPPVRHNLLKSDIVEIQIGKTGIYDHTRLGYTRQQRLDLAALLGTSETK